MHNITTCEEYYEGLKLMLEDQNVSTKHHVYPYEKEIWRSLDVIGYIKLLAYAVIMVGGLFGNLSVILTVALNKSARSVMNIYVANLAVADAMICIVCMLPHALTVYTGKRFILGAFMCKFNPFTQMTCLTSSVLILCAISCDRFMAVIRPFQSRTSKKYTSCIILVIWLVSVSVSVPFFLVKKHSLEEWADYTEPRCGEKWPVSYYHDINTGKCEVRHNLRLIYLIFVSVTLFIVPILIMFAAYAKILHKLWTSKTPGEHTEANVQAQAKSKQKVLKMVIIVLIVFVLCWTPLQVVLYVSAFQSSRNPPAAWFPEFKWFSYYIAYANSFLNPFIYGHYNQDFRNKFCLILCCRNGKRRIGRFGGGNIVIRSIRTVSTTLTTLRSGTQAFFSRRKSKSTEPDLQVTAV